MPETSQWCASPGSFQVAAWTCKSTEARQRRKSARRLTSIQNVFMLHGHIFAPILIFQVLFSKFNRTGYSLCYSLVLAVMVLFFFFNVSVLLDVSFGPVRAFIRYSFSQSMMEPEIQYFNKLLATNESIQERHRLIHQ